MPLFSKAKFPERPAGLDEVVLDKRGIQAIALDLLTAFDALCKRHGLKYYLCGGTLLGAVRHKGFIPWDDDVDVFMARPDYDRLVELCRTEGFGSDTEFACLENGKLPRAFARIYYKKASVQRKYHRALSGPFVWMDILPVDGLPDDRAALERLYKKRIWMDGLNFHSMWKTGTGPRKLIVLKRWARYLLTALGPGPWGWARRIDRMGRKRPFERSDTVGCLTGGRYGAGEAMPRSAYIVPAKVTFEGREFETMSCWREYLTGIYGDYMQLPPEDKRKPHMDYVTMRRADYEALRNRHPELSEK